MSIKFNSIIANLNHYAKAGVLNDKKMDGDTQWVIDSMNVKTPSAKTQIKSLSGGNQQKVIIGRWLLTDPEVLLLDEPTRGIDVGAKYEIYQLIIDLANKGKGVRWFLRNAGIVRDLRQDRRDVQRPSGRGGKHREPGSGKDYETSGQIYLRIEVCING